MGANVYLEDVASYGFASKAASTAIKHYIPGIKGKRIAIRAFGATCGTTATYLYFMQVLGRTTLNGAHASHISSGIILSAGTFAGQTLASNDWLAFEMDDGSIHFTYVTNGTYRSLSVANAFDDTAASGNRVWVFLAYSDTGHLKFKLAASTQTTKELDGGIFYADAAYDPMLVYHANDHATAGSIDYISVDYINK